MEVAFWIARPAFSWESVALSNHERRLIRSSSSSSIHLFPYHEREKKIYFPCCGWRFCVKRVESPMASCHNKGSKSLIVVNESFFWQTSVNIHSAHWMENLSQHWIHSGATDFSLSLSLSLSHSLSLSLLPCLFVASPTIVGFIHEILDVEPLSLSFALLIIHVSSSSLMAKTQINSEKKILRTPQYTVLRALL